MHNRLPQALLVVAACGLGLLGTLGAVASAPHAADPWPCDLPMGAIPPQLPMWCMPMGADGPPTFVQGPNAWRDDFNHGLSNAPLGAGYKVYENMGSNNQTGHFRHNNHWMVDINGVDQDGPGPWDLGGAMMRIDRSFRFDHGLLVVEAEVAAGVLDYGGAAWTELIVTTAPDPTYPRPTSEDTYAYDNFALHDTVGCRLPSDRRPVCALFDNTERGPGQGGRTMEFQDYQSGGAAVHQGGGPYTPETAAAYRTCNGTDPDTNCRDTFRWEIAKDRFALYVNGVLYMLHSGFPPEHQLPDRFLNSPVYVYFGDRIHKPGVNTVRFHWDHLAVNPELLGGGPAATPTVGPTATAVPTATAPATRTPTPLACQVRYRRRNADGTYSYSAWATIDSAKCAGIP